MANSSISHSPSPTSCDAEEPHDDSTLASVFLIKKNPRPGSIPNEPERNDEVADHPNEAISSPTPMVVASQSKPRGRPKGSKNKPKYAEPTIKTHILEIQPGSDILETIRYFAQTQNAGVSVVNGVGRVRTAMVHNPVAGGPHIVLGGAHEILSLNGIHVGPAQVKSVDQPLLGQGESNGVSYSTYSGTETSYFVVHLAGPEGTVWGGAVTGKLVAASNVLLNVSTFADYQFHRLISDDPDPIHQNSSTSGDGSSGGEPDTVDSNPSSSAGVSAEDGTNLDSTPGRKRARLSNL